MSPFKTSLVAASALVSCLGFAGAAHAQGFYLQEQSARGAGRAFSGEVADTGAGSLWWNPASIAGTTEGEAIVNVAGILPHGKVEDRGTVIRRPGGAFTPVGGDGVARNPINNGVLPSGSFAYPLSNRVALGLAITSPFSFTTDYDANSWARYSADRTKLLTMDIQPSIAVAVTDWLRVGAGANIEYTDAALSNALPNLAAALPDGKQELKGNGWDLGWTAGFQLHNDFVTVGFAYKSAIKHRLKGSLEISGLQGPLAAQNRKLDDIHANFYTPGQLIVGARFNVTPKLALNTQLTRFSWDKFDAIRLEAPLNTAIPENYRETWSVAAGLDYAASPKLTLRAGVQSAQTPTRDGERDARVPDANRWNFGLGGSYKATRNLTIDTAVNYIDFEDESIDRPTAAYVGTPVQTPVGVSGTLRDAHAFVLSLGARMTF